MTSRSTASISPTRASLDLGRHDFSILRYWLDEVPHHVSTISRGTSSDDSRCCLPWTSSTSGTTGTSELSWLAPQLPPHDDRRFSEVLVYDDASTEPFGLQFNCEKDAQIVKVPADVPHRRHRFAAVPAAEPAASGNGRLLRGDSYRPEAPRSSAHLGLEVDQDGIKAVDGEFELCARRRTCGWTSILT